jgi:hypothetical protein
MRSGAHFLLGVTAGLGPAWLLSTNESGPSTAQFAFGAALRLGVLVAGRHEIILDIAPFTDVPYPDTGALFRAMFMYGYDIPLYDSKELSVSWPLRLGVGFMLGDAALAVLRADLFGVAFRFGRWLVSFDLPSFSDGIEGVQGHAVCCPSNAALHLLSWRFNATAAVLF